jgi:hypothetical protein
MRKGWISSVITLLLVHDAGSDAWPELCAGTKKTRNNRGTNCS